MCQISPICLWERSNCGIYDKLLQAIFSKPLFKAPLRLQKLLLDLQKYDLKVKFTPEKNLLLADSLGRAYLKETKEDLGISDSEFSVVLTFLSLSRKNQLKIFTSIKRKSAENSKSYRRRP